MGFPEQAASDFGPSSSLRGIGYSRCPSSMAHSILGSGNPALGHPHFCGLCMSAHPRPLSQSSPHLSILFHDCYAPGITIPPSVAAPSPPRAPDHVFSIQVPMGICTHLVGNSAPWSPAASIIPASSSTPQMFRPEALVLCLSPRHPHD